MRTRTLSIATLLLLAISVIGRPGWAQTGGTGAISGTVTDPQGAVIAGAQIRVANLETGETRVVESSSSGTFVVPLLPPGVYGVQVSRTGFMLASFPKVRVNTTETVALNASLAVGAISEQITVEAGAQQLQTETSALGRVTSSEMVAGLPLVARNYTQILGLNAGTTSNLNDATTLGRGGALSTIAGTAGTSVQGAAINDNNFQLDGVNANDIQSTGNFSGGIAIPNPDTIQEFKVQTGLYDASYGRNAGANVNVVTKAGSNQYHGSAWEFLRNEDLNANSFFGNQAGQPRPELRQNQYGFTLGGPVIKDKILMFGSYQGTKQINGVGSSCSSNFREPPLTDDRSRAALGKLFTGQKSYAQTTAGVGPGVLPDGSNISPQAFALMNLKFPNGQYVIPTPQRIDPTQPFATQGFSAVSDPCTFSENQYMTNGDYYLTPSSKLAFRYFAARSNSDTTLPSTNIGGPPAPGWPVLNPQQFYNASIKYTQTITPHLLNELQVGYHRMHSFTVQTEAFQYADIGATVPVYDDNPRGTGRLAASRARDARAEAEPRTRARRDRCRPRVRHRGSWSD